MHVHVHVQVQLELELELDSAVGRVELLLHPRIAYDEIQVLTSAARPVDSDGEHRVFCVVDYP